MAGVVRMTYAGAILRNAGAQMTRQFIRRTVIRVICCAQGWKRTRPIVGSGRRTSESGIMAFYRREFGRAACYILYLPMWTAMKNGASAEA